MSAFLVICSIFIAGVRTMGGSMPGRLDPDDVVATVRGKAITYRTIRCHPEINAKTAKLMGDHRPIEQICLDAERQALRHRLARALIQAAADICPVVPTDEQLIEALPNVFDEDDIARLTRLWRAKAMVVRRVSRGEDAAKVTDEVLVPLGVSRDMFLQELPYWAPEGAEQVLSTDYASVVRERRRGDATFQATWAIIARRHRGDDDARRRFWEEIIRVTKTTVREGFEPPDWRRLP
ncbi:MAG TPA: hypothetical protein VEO74_00170 [Thermoanaerobaculia bacterium]|nr:hypothetical protein [Thermoanaerobaculia bacterium]